MPDRYFQLKNLESKEYSCLLKTFSFMSSEISPIPRNLNALRACKLCKLIKNYDEVSCESVGITRLVSSQRM